jgi:hypothetical protein
LGILLEVGEVVRSFVRETVSAVGAGNFACMHDTIPQGAEHQLGFLPAVARVLPAVARVLPAAVREPERRVLSSTVEW